MGDIGRIRNSGQGPMKSTFSWRLSQPNSAKYRSILQRLSASRLPSSLKTCSTFHISVRIGLCWHLALLRHSRIPFSSSGHREWENHASTCTKGFKVRSCIHRSGSLAILMNALGEACVRAHQQQFAGIGWFFHRARSGEWLPIPYSSRTLPWTRVHSRLPRSHQKRHHQQRQQHQDPVARCPLVI
ncbi:hypothetical protein BJV74DRAFT_375543 [Russula compacta]|nr:hypothetical protein BJV74DRAFT_375543 [Russula compacta]